jgi:hypothetical protein
VTKTKLREENSGFVVVQRNQQVSFATVSVKFIVEIKLHACGTKLAQPLLNAVIQRTGGGRARKTFCCSSRIALRQRRAGCGKRTRIVFEDRRGIFA